MTLGVRKEAKLLRALESMPERFTLRELASAASRIYRPGVSAVEVSLWFRSHPELAVMGERIGHSNTHIWIKL